MIPLELALLSGLLNIVLAVVLARREWQHFQRGRRWHSKTCWHD